MSAPGGQMSAQEFVQFPFDYSLSLTKAANGLVEQRAYTALRNLKPVVTREVRKQQEQQW